MGVVPKKRLERVQFYENHIAPFTTNATVIGVTSSEVSGLSAKTTAARTAYNAATAARQASETATNAYYDAVESMTVAGAGLLKKIRGQAETTGNANVYNLAQIPPPATPSNRPAPGQPNDFKVQLLAGGAIEITFKCDTRGAQGTMYQFFRKAAGEPDSAFVYLGGTGEKKMVDDGIPPGVVQVVYQCQAVRSTMVGLFAQFNVNFGTGANGATTATLVEASPVKLAA